MTLAERNELIERFAYLVPATRRRVVPKPPWRVPAEDLEGAGYLALVKAADRFDPARGVKFSMFAIAMIRGALLEFLRQEDWAPRSERDRQKRGEPALIYELISWEYLVYGGDICDADDRLLVLDTLADPSPGPEERAMESIEAELLWQEVGSLPSDERACLREYYGPEALTFRAIGAGRDRCESRAKQWHGQGLARLRERLAVGQAEARVG